VQINFTEGTNTSYKASYQFGNSATFSATGRPNGPIATFYHTVVAARTSNNKADSLILFYDDLKSPDTGKAKLRFVNLTVGTGTLNVFNGQTSVVQQCGIWQGSKFFPCRGNAECMVARPLLKYQSGYLQFDFYQCRQRQHYRQFNFYNIGSR
jgi:hypothetical protein